jgi:hypothetical protein
MPTATLPPILSLSAPFTNGPDDFGDLHLPFGSPALDAGLNAVIPPGVTDLGLLCLSRAHVDVGAYEYQNLAPTASPQSLVLNQDTSPSVTLTGSDPENDSLSYLVTGGPGHGTLSGAAPDLIYTPAAGYVGTDSFTFTVTDSYGASHTATVSLTVKDTTAPVIRLNGSNPMSVNQGSAFTDPGAAAVDNVDGSVPVSVSGSVNTAVPGSYTRTYSATDAAGNTATKTRTVNVLAVSTPKIVVTPLAIARVEQVVGFW